MLYNVNERYGVSVMFGDKAMALMVTEKDVKSIIRKGLPYAIEHNYGVFTNRAGIHLEKEDVTEGLVNKGFYVKNHKELITWETVMEDLLGYVMFHPELLFQPDEAHMPKEPKTKYIYTMVDVAGWTARKAAEVLEMGY